MIMSTLDSFIMNEIQPGGNYHGLRETRRRISLEGSFFEPLGKFVSIQL